MFQLNNNLLKLQRNLTVISQRSWIDKLNKNKNIIYLMYSDGQVWANSVDPDEMPQFVASHQGLHCLSLILQFLDTTSGRKLHLFKF